MTKILQKSAFRLFLVFAIATSFNAFAQTPFTITQGFTQTAPPTGIQLVSYDGATACSTSSNGANAVTTMTLKALPGYEFKVTSVSGIGVRSNAGPADWTVQVVNNGTVNGTTIAIGSSSNCSGTATFNTLNVPTANQQVNEGSTIIIKVMRAPGSATGGGYSHVKEFKVQGTVQAAVPPVPNAPVATDATNNNTGSSFTANWNAVTGATGYRLDVATDNAFVNKLEDYDDIAVSGTSKLVNIGILPSTTYYYRVRAEINAETSVNSNTITVLVSPFILQTPTATAATITGTTGFTANWDAVAGATGYYLDVSTSPDFGVIDENTTTETFTNMPAAASAYALRTWTGNGDVAWTANAARTDRFIPSSTTDRLVCIFENVVADNAYVESGAITGDFNYISFDAWKVLSNGTFSVITASVLTGASFENETILGTQATPSNTTTKNVFTKTLTTPLTGPYKIRLAVTDNTGGARTGIDNLKFGSRIVTAPSYVTGYNNLDAGNVTSYQVTGLEPGIAYYYRVRAYTATDTSGNSNVITTATSCIVVTPPTASLQQFCGSATVADLDLAEDNVHWYTVQTAGTELASTIALSSGTYYASLFTGNCESTRVAVTVTVSNTIAPVVAPIAVCAAATVADLTANGTALKWYADATIVTPLTPETAVVAGDYYVTQTLNGCESPRALVTVSITPTPVAPTAADQTFCGTATVAQLMPAPVTGIAPITESFELGNQTGLTGTHNFASGPWAMQNGSNDGSGVNAYSGKSLKFISFHRYTSPAFNKIKTIKFYARAEGAKTLEVMKVVGAVESSLQIINLTTTLQQYTIQVNEVNDNVKIKFLGETTSVLAYMDEVQFIFSDGTPEIKWYADATGGTALASSEALVAGDYFVAQVVNGCEGPRTEVEVTINTIPDAPVATALILCGEPTVAQLTATGDNLKWYSGQTGGTALLNTEDVTAGNYYVSQTINDCESPRTEVAVTINPIPAAPATTPLSFCGSATVAELTATGTNLKWYAAETGGSALADTEALTSITYYVTQTVGTCESPRASVLVTVNPVPDAPEAAPLAFCGATVASQLTATNGTGLKWYTVETGGTALTGTETVATGDYYVSQTVNGCESARTEVAVTVNPIPSAPSITEVAQTYCSGATVADFLPDNAAIKWYTGSSNGTALADDTVLNSGLSIYYASQTVNGCESTARTAVAVMINTTPQPATNGNYTFCNSATAADLTATGTNLKWYASLTATDEIEDTAVLASGSYYVTQTLNTCESARKEVVVTVNEATAPTASPITLCGASAVEDLTATGTGLKWYATATETAALQSTATVSTGTYYVSQTIGTCESARTPVSVTVNNTATITAGPFTFCNEGTVGELTATGASVKWYASLTATDEMEETVALSTGTYFVSQTINDCESTRTAVSVTITNPVAAGDAVQQYNTGETLADLDVTGPGLIWYADEDLTQVLPATTVLTEWYTYYAVANIGTCAGEALAVQVDDLLGNGGFDVKRLQYYPNPVKDVVTISYQDVISSVEVYNLLGQLVINKTPEKAIVQVDMSALQTGTYILKLQSGNSTQTIKLIKQ